MSRVKAMRDRRSAERDYHMLPVDSLVGLVRPATPSAPMIPQLLRDGRCPGRVFRNLRAVLGRMPTKRELGLRWWQTVELDMTPDEMQVVNTVARRVSLLLRGKR